MRETFHDEDVERIRRGRDRELTLNSGSLVAIAAGLLLLCGLCFGWGYSVGHESSAPAPNAASPPATEQEPLQASGNLPKPSAIDQTPVASPAAVPADTGNAAPSGAEPAASNAPSVLAPATANQTAVQAGAPAQAEVRPALPAAGVQQSASTSAAPGVHSAIPQSSAQQFMVQVAAVANAADADVLTKALERRGYPVISKREPVDNFVHVRVGPFASRALADQWRMQLLNDGYNAQVQP